MANAARNPRGDCRKHIYVNTVTLRNFNEMSTGRLWGKLTAFKTPISALARRKRRPGVRRETGLFHSLALGDEPTDQVLDARALLGRGPEPGPIGPEPACIRAISGVFSPRRELLPAGFADLAPGRSSPGPPLPVIGRGAHPTPWAIRLPASLIDRPHRRAPPRKPEHRKSRRLTGDDRVLCPG